MERSESEDEPEIPIALIERSTSLMVEYIEWTSTVRVLYLVALRLLSIFIIVF